MSDADLLWKLIAMSSVIGNAILIIRQVLGKNDKREIVNDPLEVREHPEFVSRRECTILHHGFENRLLFLERRAETQQTEFKKDVSDLHDKMNAHHGEIMRALGRLEGS
jgi:hypothetical protein